MDRRGDAGRRIDFEETRTISRREWLGLSLSAGATLALTPELLRALQALQQPGGKLIQRAIPSSGERLPVIGLGRGSDPVTSFRAALFRRVGTTPLPEWAAEFDAGTWGQFFLKYVVSHPAVTVIRAGTTRATHMLENLGGGIGRLPNEATRKRMAELVDALPALAPWRLRIPGAP